MLKRKPKNLGEVLGGQSDGEVFWKIRTGNAFMPSSSSALTEEETWHVVNFVRTLETPKARTHPWASFEEGAWVEIHTDYEQVMGKGGEQISWSSDSRITVGESKAGAVSIKYENPANRISEQASVVVPAVDSFAGLRALGQGPRDIFPFGAERESGATSKEKLPTSREVKTETLRQEDVVVEGATKTATVVERRWKTTTESGTQDHVLVAWIVDGLELPVKWTQHVDGKVSSESELVSSEDLVKVGKASVPCIVILTREHRPDGVMTKRRWSSNHVPGFMVKMESEMTSEMYSLSVIESVKAFEVPAIATANVDREKANPPGSRPALGFQPDYQFSEDGVLVGRVTSGGPGDQGGLQEGDLIVEVDGNEVLGLDDYMAIVPTLLIGKEISVRVDRGGHEKDLRIVVGER